MLHNKGNADIQGSPNVLDARARILLVDDDERNLLALGQVLEDLAEVVCVTSGRDALRQLGIGHEALEDVGRALRVADQHQPLVRRQLHRHDRVFDLSAVIGAAGEAVDPDRGGLVAEALQMFQGELKGAHEATEAIRAQPRHHGETQLQSCRSEIDGLARTGRLVGEAVQDLVAGPVLAQLVAMSFVDGAQDLIGDGAGLDPPRPADHRGRPHAPFEA